MIRLSNTPRKIIQTSMQKDMTRFMLIANSLENIWEMFFI